MALALGSWLLILALGSSLNQSWLLILALGSWLLALGSYSLNRNLGSWLLALLILALGSWLLLLALGSC
jgi:hypothetical protein